MPRLAYASVGLRPGRFMSDRSYLAVRCSIDGTTIEVVGDVRGLPPNLGQLGRVIQPAGHIDVLLPLTLESELSDPRTDQIRREWGSIGIDWVFAEVDTKGIDENSILGAPLVSLY